MQPIAPPSPPWVAEATSTREAVQLRSIMLIRMCAAHYSIDGAISDLSVAMGYGPRTLGHYTQRGRLIPPHVALKMEELLGRRVIRREDLRPDHFLTPENEETPGE